jgi:hypothetical protein
MARWIAADKTDINQPLRTKSGGVFDELRAMLSRRFAGYITLGRMKPSTLLWILAASFVASGVLEDLLPAHVLANAVLHGVVIAVICYMWCRADALTRGTVPPYGIPIIAGVLPFIGIPVYLFKTRPARAAWIGIAKAIGLVFGLAVLGAISSEAIRALRT